MSENDFEMYFSVFSLKDMKNEIFYIEGFINWQAEDKGKEIANKIFLKAKAAIEEEYGITIKSNNLRYMQDELKSYDLYMSDILG